MSGSLLDVTLNPGAQPKCRRHGGVRAGYTDDADRVAATYHEAEATGKLHKVDDGRKRVSARDSQDRVKYDVVADYGKLMTLVGHAA